MDVIWSVDQISVFVVILMTAHFTELNDINQSFSATAGVGQGLFAEHVSYLVFLSSGRGGCMASTKSLDVDVAFAELSLIYSRNSNGPITDP